jgi:hypothetical protein
MHSNDQPLSNDAESAAGRPVPQRDRTAPPEIITAEIIEASIPPGQPQPAARSSTESSTGQPQPGSRWTPARYIDGRRWQKRLLLIGTAGAVGLATLWSFVPTDASLATKNAVYLDRQVELTDVVSTLDNEFAATIADTGLETAPPASWQTVTRRLSMALVGKGLSLEEYRWVESLPEGERINRWTEALLDDPRSHAYLAERFARAFVGTSEGPFVLFRRRKFQLWLADQIAENRNYDAVVRSMVSGEGLWTDNPGVNFITATMDEQDDGRADPIRLAGRTSRAFLGMRIDCLQCHDDFLGSIELGEPTDPRGGTQQDFHRLAAFYSGTRLTEGNIFAGIRDDAQPYEYQYLNQDTETTVEPSAPFLNELMPSEGEPRDRLGRWITHPQNKPFARATVNRMWAFVYGKALVDPIDDIAFVGPFPAGLETLAEDFIEHDYDLRRLIRILTRLDVFRRDSNADFEIDARHEDVWAVFPMTQLRPEQVVGSLHQSARLKRIDRDSSFFSQIEQFGTINDFLKSYGDRGEDEFIADSVTVPQRLMVMNGNVVTERIGGNPIANAGPRIAMLADDDEHAIEIAFYSVLNRRPSQDDLATFRDFLDGQTNDARVRAIADIYWVLYNSTEFLWNH